VAGGVTEESARPLLRVVRGNPTAEELAALIAVVAARSAAIAASAPQHRSLWRDRTALVHAPLMPRGDAWRASGQPTHR